MKNKIAELLGGVFGLNLLEVELSELVEEERVEEKEEEKIRDVLAKKKEILSKLAVGLSNVKEVSQVYNTKTMIKLLFGNEGILKLNEKLKDLDEKIIAENKKELKDLKEAEGESRKEGLDRLFSVEQRIYTIHKQMKGLFELFDDRIEEENKLLKDKNIFGKMVDNTFISMNRLKELNEMIIFIVSDLESNEHDVLKEKWEKRILRKIDQINSLSMSKQERKDILAHVRRYLINPVKKKYHEASWVDELERNMELHEHTERAHEWENKLEQAVWDLSEEIRKEQLIQKHLEKAFRIIDKEMEVCKKLVSEKKAIA